MRWLSSILNCIRRRREDTRIVRTLTRAGQAIGDAIDQADAEFEARRLSIQQAARSLQTYLEFRQHVASRLFDPEQNNAASRSGVDLFLWLEPTLAVVKPEWVRKLLSESDPESLTDPAKEKLREELRGGMYGTYQLFGTLDYNAESFRTEFTEIVQRELAKRRANRPAQKEPEDTAHLGRVTYHYCLSCGAECDSVSEKYDTREPHELCYPCEQMRNKGLLEPEFEDARGLLTIDEDNGLDSEM